jgi:hypothetical protein
MTWLHAYEPWDTSELPTTGSQNLHDGGEKVSRIEIIERPMLR